MTTKSHLNNYSQEQLIELSNLVTDRLDDLFKELGVELNKGNKYYYGCCPIHGGDKSNAFNLYHRGNITGNWKCRTKQCEKHFISNIIGFTRGVLSHLKLGWRNANDEMVSFKDTVNFLLHFTGQSELNDVEVDFSSLEKKQFIKTVEIYNDTPKNDYSLFIPRKKVVESLQYPCVYFLNRGYSREILDKYDVGICLEPNKPMSCRAVVPIYNDDRTHMIACTGRSIYERCELCNLWHNPLNKCPDKENIYKYAKWKHSKGPWTNNCLYNYWFAKQYIKESGIAIIVESPGNVWKLEEAGFHNSVAIFGSSLKEGQKKILEKSGAMSLILLTDPDSAGTLCADTICQELGEIYAIYRPEYPVHMDIGEMPTSKVKGLVLPIVEEAKKDLIL